MAETFYEIAEEYERLLKLVDDVTDPRGARCQFCNPDGWDTTQVQLHRSATGEDEVCGECDGSGWGVQIDDESLYEAIQEAMDEIEDSLQNKSENIVRLLQRWDMMAGAIKAEETRLRDRRKAYEAKQERLRKYVLRHMQIRDLKKIETPVKNISRVQGRERVIIDDEYELPQGTFDTEMIIKPDKKLIMERHKQGIATEGAHVERGDDYLLIR